MNKNSLLPTIALAVALVAVTVYFQSSVKGLDSKLDMLLSKTFAPAADSKGGKQSDPYLKKAVNNTVLKRAVDIQKLYTAYVDKNPSVTAGKIKLDWQIDRDGRTISPEIISSDFNDKPFEASIVEAVSHWKFPPPPFGNNRYIEHTFIFSESKPQEDDSKEK